MCSFSRVGSGKRHSFSDVFFFLDAPQCSTPLSSGGGLRARLLENDIIMVWSCSLAVGLDQEQNSYESSGVL